MSGRGCLRGLRAAIAACLVAATAGCGESRPVPNAPAEQHGSSALRSLMLEARPIGRGARFHPTAGRETVSSCRARLGARTAVHVELFAKNRVALLPAGIGTAPPRTAYDGRITDAGCYGPLVTIDPTGVVLIRAGVKAQLGALFRTWGQPLSDHRIASFRAPAGTRVNAFVDGRRWRGAPGAIPLRAHAEIVLEVGPYVPPHRSYTFPPDTWAAL